MSYILDALKRSKQERELGQIPILFSDSDIQAEPPPKKNLVVLIALALAILAVAVSFYAAFAKHYFVAESKKPTLIAPSVVNLPNSKSSSQSIKEQSLPSAQQEFVEKESVAVNKKEKSTTRLEQRDRPAVDESVIDAPRVAVQDDQAEAPRAPLPPNLAYRKELLDLKRQIEQQENMQVSNSEEKESTNQKNMQSSVAFEHAQQRIINRPVYEQHLEASFRKRIPSRDISVHVYSDNPLERFVFINSRKMTEGERNNEGLMVEEIHPDGIVFSYDGTRFFKSL